MTEKITTKAALCRKCNQFHLIASIESFNRNKDTQKEFAGLMREGFLIVEVTTFDAISGFGYC